MLRAMGTDTSREDGFFDLQPTLEGERLTLRPLAPDDFESLLEAASDPLIWAQHPEPDRHTRDVFRRYFDGGIASGGAFAVIDRASGRIIGSSRYCHLRPEEREVEIGWTFLERAYWGGSCNLEMKTLMIDHALRFVDRVVFVVGEHNIRSQRAMLKIGARLWKEITRPEPDGGSSVHHVYAITRESWR